MKLAKSQHEAFALFFEKPTREGLRDLIKQNIGETDYLDFKSEWPDLIKVSKHIIALANSGGGAIVLGIHQTDEGQIEAKGLSEFKDKVDIVKIIKNMFLELFNMKFLIFLTTNPSMPPLKEKCFKLYLLNILKSFYQFSR